MPYVAWDCALESAQSTESFQHQSQLLLSEVHWLSQQFRSFESELDDSHGGLDLLTAYFIDDKIAF